MPTRSATPKGPLGHMNLRRACELACVPLRDASSWPLSDKQVVIAVEAARDGASLLGAVEALSDAIASGRLRLGSRISLGSPHRSELVVLGSVLRSPVAADALRRRRPVKQAPS